MAANVALAASYVVFSPIWLNECHLGWCISLDTAPYRAFPFKVVLFTLNSYSTRSLKYKYLLNLSSGSGRSNKKQKTEWCSDMEYSPHSGLCRASAASWYHSCWCAQAEAGCPSQVREMEARCEPYLQECRLVSINSLTGTQTHT